MPLEFRGVSSLYRNFSAECYKWGEEQSHFEKLPIYIFLISPARVFYSERKLKWQIIVQILCKCRSLTKNG